MIVRPEFSNLGHSICGAWTTFRWIYNVVKFDFTMQEQKYYQNCKKLLFRVVVNFYNFLLYLMYSLDITIEEIKCILEDTTCI